jgi:hypothetical protein
MPIIPKFGLKINTNFLITSLPPLLSGEFMGNITGSPKESIEQINSLH